MDHEKFSVPPNDAKRSAQCAEEREPPVKHEAGTSENKEEAAFKVIEHGG
jgi:hypothetical protein